MNLQSILVALIMATPGVTTFLPEPTRVTEGTVIQKPVAIPKAEIPKPVELPEVAPKPEPKPEPVIQPQPVRQAPRASGVVSNCGDNYYAHFIYMHESSCRLDARNASGCVGIGQACPASKLLSVCPTLEYACQNAFFTAYANSRYGGWAGAYAAWQSKHWW